MEQRISDNEIHGADDMMKKGLLKISVDENDDKLDQFEEQQKLINQKIAYENYKKSGVPAKFFESSIKTFIPENDEEMQIIRTIAGFIGKPANRVLIMYGNHGCGKSHLGCAIIRECGGAYILSSKLCVEWEAAISYHAKRTRMEILEHYSRIEMLVIDECGKYMLNSDLEKFLLSSIICERYENNLPTVLITNESKKDFVEFLGLTAYDRLREVCTTLCFEGESKR